ncbi:MAG: PEGA domain-containing protein [Methanoregulaceae archaeon]|nr:PEGA domain-containing protein [Methanoregulaceae archaeon]
MAGMAITGTCASAAEIDAAIGDRVSLSGSAIGTDTIYLFVTGPGLASNGVKVDSMRSEVVTNIPSSFTVTDVKNDRWEYSWNTARQGFHLREGIYTVYATKQPYARDALSGGTYGTIEVSLTYGGRAFQSAGTVLVDTTPSALLYVDDSVKGVTPQNLSLPIGTHILRLEREGYLTLTETVPVAGGTVTEIRRTMVPVAGTPETTGTIPAPALTQATPLETEIPVTVIPETTRAGGPALAALSAFLVSFIVLKRP